MELRWNEHKSMWHYKHWTNFFVLSVLKSMFDFQYLSINLVFVLFDLFVILFFFIHSNMFVLFCIFSSDLFPFYVFVCILNTDTSSVLIQYYSGIAIFRFIFTVRCSCFCNSLVHSFPFYKYYFFFYLVFFYSSHHVILILITFFYLFILVCMCMFFFAPFF